eukprot:TRINITY_DN1746_c0_g1_i3.p1 TRINITY_DN1746_c0_g1~~TRINITY_DN1746_c0_g1_i3.p1  ORF type:complete len:761 (+),score=192.05 TRINITY_DN1746_c0_g1_i3:72-2354(+)
MSPSPLAAFKITDEQAEKEHEDVSRSSICRMTLADWTMLDRKTLTQDHAVFRLDDDKPVEAIVRSPNASDNDTESIARVANPKRGVCAQKFCLGRLVQADEVRCLNHNGKTEVVLPGRWARRPSARLFSTWGNKHKLTSNHISEGTFTLVRVSRGELGIATENGMPVLLNEGLHVYNTALFQFVKFVNISQDYISHMSYHVVRVPKGAFAKITENNRPKLLPEGTHTVDSPVFKFDGLEYASKDYIKHGTIHIIQVPKGSVGLLLESNCPRLLHEGLHIYDSATLTYGGARPMMETCINHGTITRFRVQKGEVGLTWLENEPQFVEEPGTYMVDSPTFKFEAVKKVDEKYIQLGSKKIVTVNSGEVGVSFNNGRLQILSPGRHVIETAEHSFDDFLSTQQRSMRLRTTTSEKGVKKVIDEMLLCETKDLVRIGIRADVFYRIADPEKAILKVGREGIDELIMETAIATLTNIMRSTALNEIAQSALPSAVSEKDHQKIQECQALGTPSAPLFFDKAHDQFLAKLHDDFMERYGLEVTNIRIEQFKIMDETLAKSISQQAIMTAETESKLANLEGQTQISTQEQERQAKVKQIQAEAEALAQKTAADAEVSQAEAMARAQQVRAEAEANYTRVKAEAEAAATKIRAEATVAEAEAAAKGAKIRANASIAEAEAEAEGIRLKAKAEAERAKVVSETPLGEKLALLDVYSGAVKSANEGVEKVVYMDPAASPAQNPFALLTLQSMQNDLRAVTAATDIDKRGK